MSPGSASRVGRTPRSIGALALTLLVTAASPHSVAAHDVNITSMARVFIDQIDERRFSLSIIDAGLPPIEAWGEDLLPAHCALTRAQTGGPAGSPRSLPVLTFECSERFGLDDEIVLPLDLTGLIVVLRPLDGDDTSAFVRGRGRTVTIRLGDLGAGTASRIRLAGRYTVIGAEHILFGIDHLLFVLGLLLLVRGIGSLIATITAFTVAHSITLGAAVLGLVSVNSAAVEATIALSIVLLAREVVTGSRGGSSLVHRYPWVVAFGFGLLHGFGFAGALGEIGLPSAEIPWALLSFNVGVELGQLAFVGVLLALNAASRRVFHEQQPRLVPALGYALGAVSVLWFFDRLPGLWA